MVPCMPVGRKLQNIVFTKKVQNFQMVIIVPKTLISVANWFQPNIERFEMYSENHCMFLIVQSNGEIYMNFWVEFRKCKSLHFLTHGHTWDRLVYDTHETL